MYFQSVFFTLASLAALVSSAAIPEADASNTIEARVSPGFYFCKDVGFNGQCYFDASPFGNCGEYIYSPTLQNFEEWPEIEEWITNGK